MQAALLNGHFIDPEQPAFYLNDRGWQYGDGLFETMLLQAGVVRFMTDHIERLQTGCARLGIPAPTPALLLSELNTLCGSRPQGVVKLTLTRSGTQRGYRPSLDAQITRLWQLFDLPASTPPAGIQLRWCETRLSRNTQLAGIKHCNRLEQVLAQAEWSAPDITEGLMLDTEGELICATMNNVFLVLEGVLVTPDLRYSGIAGVMRKNLLRIAAALQIETEQRAVRAEELLSAQEVFVCNAVRGIQPVIQLEQQHWPVGSITARLITALQAD